MNNTVDQSEGKSLSHRDYTPTLCPRPAARDVVSLLRAPVSLLKVMCRRGLNEEREEGGREEARGRFSSLCASASTLQAWHLGNVLRRRENSPCTCPGLDVSWGRDHWPALDTNPTLLPPTVRRRTPLPWETPPDWGHPLVPGWPWGTGGYHPEGTMHGEPRLLHLIPPCLVGTPGRRQT